ncbi:MAG TPA: biopolymer transporter ExbD [Candidatus Gallibacteroides avistercoris]|uniref:Biopolymer transporter ExbD n=1 Tax=Candidatus Gallibacteroides avistercoris TaxID=2840833 RepID=A0A9D1M759_9BACT|nr:biopolymer transporter ExbD [Candidatus Gallibacteroides avistercoris]
MGKFKRSERREVPPLNTSSLPDLIFTLLFFFMITTSMKEMPLMVDIDPPTATELTKLEKKSLITYLYIGKPTGYYAQKLGDENRIQLNDKFIDESDIEREMIRERAAMKEENQGYMQVSIKADRGTEMGIITATKEALKRSNNLNIVYSARGRGN